ncbi:hypothetical protein LEP1GSC089_0720 [Leptospira interrogans serovar Autumnalis str. LP101]|nr:hypothetical protein LEP1GSC089_0720 [Leptospira interrogans serovar Autumnalis str. LP101]
MRKLLFVIRSFILSLYKFISGRSLFFSFVLNLRRERNLFF